MIKIQEHLNIDHPEVLLNKLIKEYWNELNPKNKNKTSFKSNSLIEKCRLYYIKTDDPEYIRDYAGNNKLTAKRHKKFFKFLKKNNFTELRRCIFSRPDQLQSLRDDILNIINIDDLYSFSKGKFNQTKFGKLLSNKLFDYKSFRGSKFCIDTYTKLGFINATCPYCNDRKVEIVKKKKTAGSTDQSIAYFDLDHFLSKAQNPFFALSFYNLIPSCHICNSTEKGEKSFSIDTHIHPYYEAFDDYYQFKISLKILLGDTIDKIIIENKKSKGSNITISDLNLESRYDNRFEEIERITKHYLNYYKRCSTTNDFNDFSAIFFELLGVPRTRAAILKKERGKLLRDILIQLDSNNLLKIS